MPTGYYPYTSNPNQDVASLRGAIGDTNATNIVGNTANYDYFSDTELESLLALSGGEFGPRAVANAYRSLAAHFAARSVAAKTYDLSVDNRMRADQFIALAAQWDKAADTQDSIEGGFELTPNGKEGCVHPEGSPWPCSCGGGHCFPVQ